MTDLIALPPVTIPDAFTILAGVDLTQFVALEPVLFLAGGIEQAGLWIGHGVPGTIIGSHPNDEYVDLDTGDVYQLQ